MAYIVAIDGPAGKINDYCIKEKCRCKKSK